MDSGFHRCRRDARTTCRGMGRNVGPLASLIRRNWPYWHPFGATRLRSVLGRDRTDQAHRPTRQPNPTRPPMTIHHDKET